MQESESEDDILDEVDYDLEDEHDHDHDHDNEHESEAPVHPEPAVKKVPEAAAAPKEAERQLSKKERKKKELAELDALLADFGVSQKDSNSQDESRGNIIFVVSNLLLFFLLPFHCLSIFIVPKFSSVPPLALVKVLFQTATPGCVFVHMSLAFVIVSRYRMERYKYVDQIWYCQYLVCPPLTAKY